MPKRRVLFTGLALLLMGWVGGWVAAAADAAADEQLLQSAQVRTDGPGLLAYFRQRIVNETDRESIETLIRQLGDAAFPNRERAEAELIRIGLPAIGPLRKAQGDADIEISRRAERCLKRIEKVPSSTLSAAVARRLCEKSPPGAAEVLLAYLPLAEDETVADEVRESLVKLAQGGGEAIPALVKALQDPTAVRRGVAAEALIRSKNPSSITQARAALNDRDLDVQAQAALALVVHARDAATMPRLIGLLADLPQGAGWRIEELLIRLAGDQGPNVSLGYEPVARAKARDAWLDWWNREGVRLDLSKLETAPAMLGYTLVVLRERGVAGQIQEINSRNETLWKIAGLQQPTDAVVVAPNRVLLAEQTNQLVSERDFSGKVLWSKQIMLPVGLQRLPNGNTVVFSRNRVVELDSQQREVFTYQRSQHDIAAGRKLRNNEVVFLTQSGNCIRIDAQGKEIGSFSTGRPLYSQGGIDVLPSGRLLLTMRDAIAEYEPDGKKVWETNFNRPNSVQRLPNGNHLVASAYSNQGKVVEIDRQGKTVWEYKIPDGMQPWRARRR